MKFIPILENYVGSTTRFELSPNDIDIRVFYLNKNFNGNFHIPKKCLKTKSILDVDYWEIKQVIKQITEGLDCAPFLYNTITSPSYEKPSEIAIELIQNKEKLICKKLIDGALKYTERKIFMANGNCETPKNESETIFKHIYYACSDLTELYYNLINDLNYPLKMDNEILKIKQNHKTYKESIDILEDIKKKVVNLKINNEPDYEWINQFVKKCYINYE
jgi:hypothetical protein